MFPFASRLALSVLFAAAAIVHGAEPAGKVAKGGRAAQPASASRPYVPAIWGMGLGTLPEYSFKKVGVRSKQLGKKVLIEEFPSWQRIFKESHKTDITQPELLSFLLQLDPYWEEGANQAAIMSECQQKLTHVPAEEVRNWQMALSKKTGSTANRMSVIGFLMQSVQLNPDCKFDAKQSTLMLSRLDALPVEAIKSWQDAIKLDIHQSAMSIIESSDCFDDTNRFKEEPFRVALETWKEVPPAKAKPVKPPESNPEQVAANKLKLAKSLLTTNKSAGKKRLEEIVKDYEGTAAAKDAGDLLKSL